MNCRSAHGRLRRLARHATPLLPWLLLMLATGADAAGSGNANAGLDIHIGGVGGPQSSAALRVLIGLTVLSLAPAILICMTAFVRIVIVLSLLRHAIGTPETPPNVVIVSLSLFLTMFTMSPVLTQVNTDAVQPYLDGRTTTEQAVRAGYRPLRDFMVRQTREQDMALMVDLARAERPRTLDDITFAQLVPAFMLSELRAAFQVGFAVFLPFLLIDLIVASGLMSLGMMMMPPSTVALPLKLLMFVLIDGWHLVVRALLGTFR